MSYREYKEGKYIVRINEDGDKIWFFRGRWHREDGPAFEYNNGTKAWYNNGKCHREDGPAEEYADGRKHWWLNDKQYTEKEWKFKMRKRKLKVLGI